MVSPFQILGIQPFACPTIGDFTFPATTVRVLYLAHWPEAVRKMAVHVKGLVEGVLRKKMERHGSVERVEMHAQAADSDLSL